MTIAEPPDAAMRLLDTPPPPLDPAAAAAALERHYGLADVSLRALAGERDRNYMATLPGGERRVFKIYHAAEDAATRSFQAGLLLHLERSESACRVPRLLRTRAGEAACVVAAGGRDHHAILISVVPGAPCDLSAAGPALRHDLGRTAAALAGALAGCDHPAARRVLLWDPMQLGRLTFLVERIPDADLRHRLAGFLGRFADDVRPRALGLPAQVIHNDLNGTNVLVADGAVAGVIDFGDAVRAPRINEVAIAANYCMTAERDPFAALGDVMAGYDAALPLADEEVALLPDLAAARLALRVLIYGWRADLVPRDRDALLRQAAAVGRVFAGLADVAPAAGREALLARRSAGRRGR